MLTIMNPRLYIDGPELRGFRDAHKCKMLQRGQEVRIQRIKRPSKFRGICVQVIGPNPSAAGLVTPEEKAACYWVYPMSLEGR